VKSLSTALAALVCVLCTEGAARAGPIESGSGVLLTDLLAGGSLEVGAVRFHDFELIFNQLEPITETRVFALDDDPGAPGLRVEGNGAFQVFGADSFESIALDFAVSTLDAQPRIEGASWDMESEVTNATGVYFAAPAPFLDFLAVPGPGEAQLDLLTLSYPNTVFSDPGHPQPFGPQSSVLTELELMLTVSDLGSTGSADLEVTAFELRYTLAPEPSSAAMLAAGLLALHGLGHRRCHGRPRRAR
jgi:hypothetical protein